mgnify:CR=1 FL=1
MPILGMSRQTEVEQLGLTDLADGLTRGVEAVGDNISEALFEPVIRLGVTGLARSGKTVFITAMTSLAGCCVGGPVPG